MNDLDALKTLLLRDAVKTGHFVLASGKESDLYVDLRKVTLNPEGAILIGRLIWERIQGRRVEAIGGMTLGADPIATAAAIIAFQQGQPLNAFLVRKEKKAHGTQKWIEGPVQPGQRVVVVEDVITSGGSTLQAIGRIEKAGLKVELVIAVFDRLEGGAPAVEERGYQVISLLNRKDLSLDEV